MNHITNRKMFIFLHGYDENGRSMQNVGKSLKTIATEDSVFLYPNAPFKVENSSKFCWFPIILNNSINMLDEELIFLSMQHSLPYLSNYIEQNLEKYKYFDYKDIILAGFSQGAVFTLHSSLFLKKQICGAISFSGGFANPNNYIATHSINKPKILIIHGQDDKILPYQYSMKGDKELKNVGIDVEFHLLKNTKHIITNEALDISKNFVKNLLYS